MGFYEQLIQVKAERVFRERARLFCQEALSVQSLEVMAREKIPLAAVLQQGQRPLLAPETLRNASGATRKGVEYLLGLPEEKLLALLEKDLPQHVAVLRQHSGYAAEIVRAMVNLLGLRTS